MTPDFEHRPENTPQSASSGRPAETFPPRPSGDKRYPKNNIWIGALLGAIGTILAAVLAAVVATDWFPQLIGIRSDSIHVERLVLYARILYFKDRAGEAHPVITKKVGPENFGLERKEVPIFDEGLYVLSYQLHPHTMDKFHDELHSPGLVDVSPLHPTTAQYDIDTFKKAKGKTLRYKVNVNEGRHVLASWHVYNAYQQDHLGHYNSKESLYLRNRTDEAQVVFDFGALEYSSLIEENSPQIWLKTREGRNLKKIDAVYKDGLLISTVIKNPPMGTVIFCEWEWKAENL